MSSSPRSVAAVAVLVLASLVAPAPALADPAGEAWLQRIDETASVAQARLVLEVESFPAGGAASTSRTLEVWQRGDEERLVRLTAPARLAGTGLLVDGDDSLHLFLPAYPPARRVVGSKRQSAFAGTDFAMEDLARLAYAEDYTATVAGEEEGLTRLELVPREADGQAAVRLWVDGEAVVRKVEHTDRKGRLSRRLLMSEIAVVDGVPLAHRLEVEDLQTGRRTVATLRSADLQTPLAPELFTVTNLERP